MTLFFPSFAVSALRIIVMIDFGEGLMFRSEAHIAKMQRSQSKILRMITNAPWYVTNQTLHDDLKVPFMKDVIQEKSINHHKNLDIVIPYCNLYWNSNKEEG
jgi:hypothetical protein